MRIRKNRPYLKIRMMKSEIAIRQSIRANVSHTRSWHTGMTGLLVLTW